MKTIKKYSSFEELKSSDKNILDIEISKKLHSEFEKAIRALISTTSNQHENKNTN